MIHVRAMDKALKTSWVYAYETKCVLDNEGGKEA